MYKEADYADSRLRGTIVVHEGLPVYVQRVDFDMTARVESLILECPTEQVVPLDSLDVLAKPLGFVNFGDYVAYLSRKPMRNDWRQGLRPSQVVTTFCSRSFVYAPDLSGIAKCLLGRFPNVTDAIATLDSGKARDVAISRELCLSKTKQGILLRRSWRGFIGRVDGGKVVMFDKYKHLEGLLEGVTEIVDSKESV